MPFEQIKVRDFSRCSVSLQPSEFASWGDCRAELHVQAKRPLKLQVEAECARAASEEEQAQIRAEYAARELALEHEIDHKPMDVHLGLSVSYNFLSNSV